MLSGDIERLLEQLSPLRYACDWDNVGMHIGHRNSQVNTILVAVDINEAAIEKAIECGADMIVSHHPLLFHGINQINDGSFMGKRVLALIEHGICCYCMHTNFDCVGGMSKAAADRLGLLDAQVLEEVLDAEGIGRVGRLPKPMTVREAAQLVKERFDLEHVTCYGDMNEMIERTAIVPGSGKDELQAAISAGATLLISGDITYHYGIDGVAEGLNIIDAGHYGIEHIFIDIIGEYLEKNTRDIRIVRMPIDNPEKYI